MAPGRLYMICKYINNWYFLVDKWNNFFNSEVIVPGKYYGFLNIDFFQSIEFFSVVLFIFELTKYTSRQRYFQAYIQGCSAWKFTLGCLGYFFLDMHMWLKFSVLSNSKLAWIFCSDCHSQLCTLEENVWTVSWQWSQSPKYSCSLCWLQTGCCHSHTGNCSLLAICGALIRFRDSACQKVLFPSYLTYWKVSANIEKSSHISLLTSNDLITK